MAARKPALRSVTGDEKSPPAEKMSVAQAAASGSHHALLVSMRDRVARAITSLDCQPRDLASLTRRLQDIAKEIEAIDLRAKEEGADAQDAAVDEEWDSEAL